MDVDGDAMMITNNKYIVDSAEKLNEAIKIKDKKINRFLVSTDFTPKLSIKRKYNWEDLADTDIKCSSNKIGEIINLAQMLNSVYWDKKSKGATEEELFELYKDICQLNILSCIEIDRCKKLSPVDATKELNKIRQKGYLNRGEITREKQKKEVGIRPYFFKYLEGGKDYKFKKFNTGMDYLEIILDENIKNIDSNESITIPLYELLIKQKSYKADRKKIDKIKKYIKEMKYNQSKIWCGDFDNKWELNRELYNNTLIKINNMSISKEIIYTIIFRISKSYNNIKYEEYKKIGQRLLQMLYNSNRNEFLNCIKVKKKIDSVIIEDEYGDVKIYGLNYKKHQKMHTF
jgi:hypothetical protein